MKVVKAGYSVIEEKSPLLKVERIARVCYKSEELIGPGTARKMVDKLVERQHWAMLEHASLTYEVSSILYRVLKDLVDIMTETLTPYRMPSEIKSVNRLRMTGFCYKQNTRYLVTGNLRVWLEIFDFCKERRFIENGLVELVNQIYEDSEGIVDYREHFGYVETSGETCRFVRDYSELSAQERVVHESFSVLFTVDRGVTHEIVRMRDCSFAQESTRYCNYSAGKYGTEITVVQPCFWEEGTLPYEVWKESCIAAEKAYIRLTDDMKEPAQRARDVLPTSVKADIVVTTYLDEWRHIFNLRACDATGPAHPQMKEVMVPLLESVQDCYGFVFGDLVTA